MTGQKIRQPSVAAGYSRSASSSTATRWVRSGHPPGSDDRISIRAGAASGCADLPPTGRGCHPRVTHPLVRPRADVLDGPRGVRRAGSVYTASVAGQDPGAYRHVHSVLARRIRGGEYPAGARLPAETEPADEFGCGPDAAARALRALQRDGLARKVLRRGYISSGPDAHPG